MPRLIVSEAAIFLKCSPETIYRHLRLKKIQRLSINPTKVDTNEVERLLARSQTISKGSDTLRTARSGWRDDR
jgi:hypothetical protein